MEENNVVMENEAVETELVPAEEFCDESNGGSTLVGVAIGVGATLGAQWLYKKAIKPLCGKAKAGIAGLKEKKAAKKANANRDDAPNSAE